MKHNNITVYLKLATSRNFSSLLILAVPVNKCLNKIDFVFVPYHQTTEQLLMLVGYVEIQPGDEH